MQIVITADQMHEVREWAQLLLIPALGWTWSLIKKGFKALRENLNEIITENVNRIRDEMMKHLDTELKVHMDTDERQFAEVKREIKLLPRGTD
jgi:hypothetical protein